MIEEETFAPEERKLVSAVIYNRLHARMPLGIDATLRYGLHIPPTKSILESQLQSDNAYNTRKTTGLPPTPIANPGLASIQAAAHPAHVDYLYFVRKPDKIHQFFTASASAFARYECAHGYGCDDHQVALLGQPGRALALAADAERRVCRARARLALHGFRRRRIRSPPSRRCAPSASPGRT